MNGEDSILHVESETRLPAICGIAHIEHLTLQNMSRELTHTHTHTHALISRRCYTRHVRFLSVILKSAHKASCGSEKSLNTT